MRRFAADTISWNFPISRSYVPGNGFIVFGFGIVLNEKIVDSNENNYKVRHVIKHRDAQGFNEGYVCT